MISTVKVRGSGRNPVEGRRKNIVQTQIIIILVGCLPHQVRQTTGDSSSVQGALVCVDVRLSQSVVLEKVTTRCNALISSTRTLFPTTTEVRQTLSHHEKTDGDHPKRGPPPTFQ